MLAWFAFLLLSWASAGERNGVTMPDTLRAGGQELVLNGMGLRTRYGMFKVYVGGLYLPGKTHDGRAAVDLEAPKHITMRFVRALDAATLAEALAESLDQSVYASQLGPLPEARLRLAPSLRLLREDWAMAERGAPPAGEPPPFDPRDQPWFWACARGERTVALRRVEPGFVRLCVLASRRPFGEALAALEAEAGAGAEAMAARVPRWIEEALAAGWWLGLA